MMKKIMFIIFGLFLFINLTACNNQLESFVKLDKKKNANVAPPGTSISSSKSIKISPGATSSAGTQVQSRVTISPSKYKMSGSSVSGTVSLSQSRVQ